MTQALPMSPDNVVSEAGVFRGFEFLFLLNLLLCQLLKCVHFFKSVVMGVVIVEYLANGIFDWIARSTGGLTQQPGVTLYHPGLDLLYRPFDKVILFILADTV
jgi:hypothetical protein